MPQTEPQATARTTREGALIELRGDIDGTAREALAAAYDASTPSGRLLLDFEHVAYINSTGIALIVGLLSRARADQRPVHASGLSAHYREIFQITRLAEFMTIHTDDPSPLPDEDGQRM